MASFQLPQNVYNLVLQMALMGQLVFFDDFISISRTGLDHKLIALVKYPK